MVESIESTAILAASKVPLVIFAAERLGIKASVSAAPAVATPLLLIDPAYGGNVGDNGERVGGFNRTNGGGPGLPRAESEKQSGATTA